MIKFFIVAFGAGLGGGIRYWISLLSNKYLSVFFPFGTLLVNILGSLILGILIFGLDEKELLNNSMRLLLAVGFCGGLTTFSTFSLETIYLLKDSQYLFALFNVAANLILSILAVYFGYLISRW